MQKDVAPDCDPGSRQCVHLELRKNNIFESFARKFCLDPRMREDDNEKAFVCLFALARMTFFVITCALSIHTTRANDLEQEHIESQWVSAPEEVRIIGQCPADTIQNNYASNKKFVQKPTRRRDINRFEEKQKLPPYITEEKLITRPEPESPELKALRDLPAQKIGLNFTAATVANAQDPFIIPPNLNGWVGRTQYILMSYNVIRSFNKTTGKADGILNIDAASFFGVSANDVRIAYDRFSQRWLMSCEGINQNTGQVATLVLAVSDTGIISKTTVWRFYTFTNAQVIPQIRPLGTGDLDYQQLAVDKNAVYISADTFDQNGNFTGSSVVVIKKSSIGTSSLVAKVFYGILRTSAFVAPVDNFDTSPTFGYLVNSFNDQYPSSNIYNKFYFYRIINPGSTNPTLSPLISITVPNYTDPANAPYKGNLFSTSAFLQTSGSSVSACHVRNKQLYVCHNIQVSQVGNASTSGNRVGVRWYQFDLTGDATGRGLGTETSTKAPALVQWGTLFDNVAITSSDFYYIPSIMTNKNGDLVVACTVSGETSYPNIVFAGRKTTDPKGVLRSAIKITNYAYPYNFGPYVDPSNANMGQRWGDLSSLCPDPINDIDIWATQEFAALKNGWGIQVTKLMPV